MIDTPSLEDKTIDDTLLTRYELYLPSIFPKEHPKAGDRTGFKNNIQVGVMKHCIEDDYEYWHQVMQEVKDNKAYIALMEDFEGVTEETKVEIKRLYCCNNVGLQKLEYEGSKQDKSKHFYVRKAQVETEEFALRNGLSKKDLLDLYKDLDKATFALIQFTGFRY